MMEQQIITMLVKERDNLVEVGCSDDDGDGIFSNVDDCPDSPQKWTANENGCTVLELPISGPIPVTVMGEWIK